MGEVDVEQGLDRVVRCPGAVVRQFFEHPSGSGRGGAGRVREKKVHVPLEIEEHAHQVLSEDEVVLVLGVALHHPLDQPAAALLEQHPDVVAYLLQVGAHKRVWLGSRQLGRPLVRRTISSSPFAQLLLFLDKGEAFGEAAVPTGSAHSAEVGRFWLGRFELDQFAPFADEESAQSVGVQWFFGRGHSLRLRWGLGIDRFGRGHGLRLGQRLGHGRLGWRHGRFGLGHVQTGLAWVVLVGEWFCPEPI